MGLCPLYVSQYQGWTSKDYQSYFYVWKDTISILLRKLSSFWLSNFLLLQMEGKKIFYIMKYDKTWKLNLHMDIQQLGYKSHGTKQFKIKNPLLTIIII